MKYIMSNRLAGGLAPDDVARSQEAVEQAKEVMSPGAAQLSASPAGPGRPRSVVLFDADPAEVQAKMGELAHAVGAKSRDRLIVEPVMPHVHRAPPRVLLQSMNLAPPPAAATVAPSPPPAALAAPAPAPPSGAAAAPSTITATITGSGRPVRGANVQLVLVGGKTGTDTLMQKTDAQGTVSFTVQPGFVPAILLVLPASEFWSMLVKSPSGSVTVDCPPLPRTGPLGWWHQRMGIDSYDEARGRGIRVGVADTGISRNPCLAHAHDAGAYVGGVHTPDGIDTDGHGTFVCGLVGSRPVQPGDFAGAAPGAELISARVYPQNGGDANQADVANAIDALAHQWAADLVNLSLYSMTPSQIEHDAIQAALQAGTLCICSAGNDGVPVVGWPAAFPESAAVSAIGLQGWPPPEGADAIYVPTNPDELGSDGLYFAVLSCYGKALLATGPGVGIISTSLPGDGTTWPFFADTGTSVSSPLVAGVLAGLLSQSPEYLATPRGPARAALARSILAAHATSVGIGPLYVGKGLPATG
jgi:subtilisin